MEENNMEEKEETNDSFGLPVMDFGQTGIDEDDELNVMDMELDF